MPSQNGPDTRRSQDHAGPRQLTLDPPVAPGGVLPGQSKNDRNGACRDARSTWEVRIDPFPPDQIPVPAEQRLGLDGTVALRMTDVDPGATGASDECRNQHVHAITTHFGTWTSTFLILRTRRRGLMQQCQVKPDGERTDLS